MSFVQSASSVSAALSTETAGKRVRSIQRCHEVVMKTHGQQKVPSRI
jgi:hypothetical protein